MERKLKVRMQFGDEHLSNRADRGSETAWRKEPPVARWMGQRKGEKKRACPTPPSLEKRNCALAETLGRNGQLDSDRRLWNQFFKSGGLKICGGSGGCAVSTSDMRKDASKERQLFPRDGRVTSWVGRLENQR